MALVHVRDRLAALRVASAAAWLLTSCAAGVPSPRTTDPTLADLRSAARFHTPLGERDRALAELVAPGGDPAVGVRTLERLATATPGDPRVHVALGWHRFMHGEFVTGVASFAAAIEAARTSDDPLGSSVAEVAASTLLSARGNVNGFDAIFRPVLDHIARDPGHLDPASVSRILETGVRWARERGRDDDADRWIHASGCVTRWTVAGAFGPLPMLRFDETLPAEGPGPLANDYDLGPGRGRRPTWEIRARGCAANLGRGRSDAGVFVAATDFTLDADADGVLYVESPNVFAVEVDARTVATLDARRAPAGSVVRVPLTLVAGRHTLRLKVASRYSSPLVVAALLDRHGHPIATMVPALGSANVRAPLVRDEGGAAAGGLDPFARFLRAQAAVLRHETIDARELLRPLATPDHATPLTLLAWAGLVMEDPFSPPQQGHDRARRALEAAQAADPQAYHPALVLARLAANENRADDALRMAREAYARAPENPDVQSELLDRLIDRNWDGEAAALLDRAARALPDACWPLRFQLSLAQRHGDGGTEHEIVRRMRSCDALGDALALTEVRMRRWDAAAEEFQRLLDHDPEGRGVRRALVDLLRQRGESARAREGAAALLDENPEDTSLREDLADLDVALGHRDQAIALLDREIARAPAQMSELFRLRAALEEREEMAPWRLDGNAVLRAFEQSGHHYDAAAVLVLDYTVRRQMPDGSAVELTHNIVRLQSQEGVDEHATFNPPEGATVLTLRTHKADGRVLEPDAIARLDAIAYPDVHIGDAIEFEYVRTLASTDAAPGGFLAERFYFRGFDIPYDHSELVVVTPASMASSLVVDPRGPAPTRRERRFGDALVEYRWLAEQSVRMTPEPRSIAAREYIPSIALGAGATWDRFIDVLRDRLAEQDPVDPDAVRLAAEITHGATRPSEQLARLHRWVIDHIEQQGAGTPFASAPVMVNGRSGHRARVLCYLLGLRGIPCHLALVRQASGDATESALAEEDMFPSVLLRVTTEGGPQWVTAADRGAPVGWLPPALAGQPGIVVDVGAPRVRIPALDLSAHRRDIEAHVTLAADGSARAEVVERMHGAWAISWRDSLRQIDAANLEHEFESYLGRQVTAASLTALHIEGQDDPNADIVLQYSFRAPSVAEATASGLVFDGLYPAELGAAYAQVPHRTTTMYNGEALNATLTLDVTLPTASRVEDLPSDAGGAASGVTWSIRHERTPHGFVVHRSVQIPPGRVSPADYAAFTHQIRAIDTADTQRISIAVPHG